MAELSDLQSAINAEFSSRLLGGQPVLEQSNFAVMSDFIAFLQFANEQGIDGLIANASPVTATGDALTLLGEALGVGRLPPSRAAGTVQISGNSGLTLPIGTTLTRCDNVEYVTVNAVTLVDGVGVVDVEALAIGAESNFLSGGVLRLGSVVPGIGSEAISLGIIGGNTFECDEDYRARVVATYRSPCRTGTVTDYEYWARQYPGVTRVCVVPRGNGPGTVKIYVLMDGSYPNGIPAPADIDAIQDAIFGAGGLAPLGVVGQVCAPSTCVVDVTVSGVGVISGDKFTEVRAEIERTFLDFFQCGISRVCRADIEIALRGVFDGCFDLVEPSANVTIPAGCVPVLGALQIV